MVNGFLKALRKHEDIPFEHLDRDAIRSRIGDPLPPPKPTQAVYTRKDGRPPDQRSWRKAAGLTR